MSDRFIQRLYQTVQEARSMGVYIRDSTVYILAARYLIPKSSLFFEDGKHLFSALDVTSLGAMSFLYQSIRSTCDVFLDVDSAGFSALHYAAKYGFGDPFEDAIDFARGFDEVSLRDVCLSSDNSERHSVCSILLEKDRYDVLNSLLSTGIDPFRSEFQDVYISWLHEALFSDAKGTTVYLENNHRQAMQKSLTRSQASDPPEVISPMDIILLHHTLPSGNHHKCNCSFYVDHILSPLECGLKVISFSYHQLALLTNEGKLDGISNSYQPEELLDRIFLDSVQWKLGSNSVLLQSEKK